MPLDRKLTVEFIGTFFLVVTIGLASAAAGDLAPVAIGAVLMVMVFAGGHVSGAHYNPAVSLAVFVRGRMSQAEVIPYFVAQILGAVLAAIVVIVLGKDPDKAANIAEGKALLAEFLFTFALVWVILNVATARGTEGNSFYGLAIGFTVAAGAFAVGPISGGVFNPAVAIGVIIMGAISLGDIWIYLLANFVAAFVAARLFLFVQEGEKTGGDTRAAEPDDATPASGSARRRRGAGN